MEDIKSFSDIINEQRRLYGGDNLENISDQPGYGDVGKGMMAPKSYPKPGMAPNSRKKEILLDFLYFINHNYSDQRITEKRIDNYLSEE